MFKKIAFTLGLLLISTLSYAGGTLSGSITAAQGDVRLAVLGLSGINATVTGTWTGTLVAEITSDGGTTWVATDFYSYDAKLVVTSITANATVQIMRSGGATHARIRASALASGTVVIAIAASERSTIMTAASGGVTSATVLTATTNTGVIVEKGARWQVVSTPAVSNQAVASKGAGAAGVRHVVDCVSFSAGSTTAPALTKLNVNLRDGATGAGTIIGSWTVVIPAATGQNAGPFSICGLNLVGTAATAMTLEFSALLTNLFEDVTISGYSVN